MILIIVIIIVFVIIMTCASKQGCGFPLSGASWTCLGATPHPASGNDDAEDDEDVKMMMSMVKMVKMVKMVSDSF